MRQALRSAVSGCLLLITLLACSSSDDDQTSGSQKYFFLESLKQIEEGGRQLQSSDLNQDELTRALATLDQGLKLAFQVERKFLDSLDLRLGKNYQRFFVKGVENYRLGIEAGDETQQRQGLQQLARWAEFWNLEREAIEAQLNPD
jgi:hypothetical protein